jgi:hypothetical protein
VIKLRVQRSAVNPLRSQDFHLISTARGVLIQARRNKPKLENFLETRPKTLFHSGLPENPAQAEAEDSSKIKDRLEALLFAETLQGTLSPNANPGKGSVGGLHNWMPKATARIQRAAQTHSHLSSTRSVIPNGSGLCKGGIKKVTVCGSAAVPAAVRRASSPAAPSARRSGQPARCRRYDPPDHCSVDPTPALSWNVTGPGRFQISHRLRTDTHSRTRILDPGLSWYRAGRPALHNAECCSLHCRMLS